MNRVMEGVFLPEELACEILLRLPAKSLLRFKCVCKSWFFTINSPRFKFQHLLHQNDNNNNLYLLFQVATSENLNLFFEVGHRSLLSYSTLQRALPRRRRHAPIESKFESIRIRCCCNGLILFSNFQEMCCWFLWNPATGEIKPLPLSPSIRLQQKNARVNICVGFGFDAKTMDYKVVTIYDFYDTLRPTILFDMYSLKANSWTTIASLSANDLRIRNGFAAGVFAAGMLSWKAVYNEGVLEEHRETIISVDLSSGGIITTPLPSSTANPKPHEYNYPLLYKESLAVVSLSYVRDYDVRRASYTWRSFDVWVLGEYGVQKSWNKQFTIGPVPGISRIVGFWKDGKVFFQSFPQKSSRRQLILLDTLSPNQQTTALQIFEGTKPIEVFTYKENLVPL